MTLGEIQKQINQRHGAIYAQSSIYNWIVRFSKSANEQAKSFLPKTGSTWLLVREPRETDSKKIYFYDVFDIETRFLLASSVSESRQEMRNILNKASAKVKITRDQSVTVIFSGDFKTNRFIKSMEKVKTNPNMTFVNLDESHNGKQFQLILKSRKNIVRGFKNMGTAQILTEAWQVHYNFIGRNESTGHIPPAMKMGKVPFKNWTEAINRSVKA